MNPLPALLPAWCAVLPEFPSVGESIGFQATGLMVVFIALGLIWGLMEISGAIFRRRDAAVLAKASAAKAAAARVASAAPNPAPAAPIAAQGPDAATMAVIIAAVHTLLGGAAHRITSVSPAAEPALDWSREGRRDHFSSHRVR